MSLADLFPKEFRAGFAERNIQIGSVIKVFVTDTIPPKEKRLILIGCSFDKLYFASVFINTEINPHIFHTQELIDLNYEMKCNDRDFLDNDSFADCSSIKKRDSKWLHDIINIQPERVLGNISDDDMIAIRKLIKSARTISPAIKKTYGLFL